MKYITLHIERLLLHNDCVIVPGLGGFVAQNCSARYVEEEDMFLPPYRSVSFNPRLTMNDGLLINDLAQYHNIDYREAQRMVDDEVNLIHRTIASQGQYTFHGIGSLFVGDNGGYNFQPILCGVGAPALFGLDGFYVHDGEEVGARPMTVHRKLRDDDSLHLRLPMNVVRFAAAVAVAAVFFFVYIAPLGSAIQAERSEAGMLHYFQQFFTPTDRHQEPTVTKIVTATPTPSAQQHPSAEASKDLGPSDEAANVETEASHVSLAAAEAPQPEAPQAGALQHQAPQTEAPQAVRGQYAIVVASCVSERNAKAFIDRWKQQGLSDAVFDDSGSVARIYYGRFPTSEEAHTALSKLRSNHHAEFAEAWVYKIP